MISAFGNYSDSHADLELCVVVVAGPGGWGGSLGSPLRCPFPSSPFPLTELNQSTLLGSPWTARSPHTWPFWETEAHFLPPLPRRCRILSLACSKTIIEIYNLGPEGRMQDKNTVCSANLPLALQACLLESWHRGRGSGLHSWSDSPGQLSKQGLPAPRQLNLAPVFSEHCPGTSDRARSQDSTG